MVRKREGDGGLNEDVSAELVLNTCAPGDRVDMGLRGVQRNSCDNTGQQKRRRRLVKRNTVHHGCEASAALADGVQAMQAVVVMTEKSCPSVVSCVCVGVRVC